MNKTYTINCKNYFNKDSFNEVCKVLENGDCVSVYIDCIGHTRNNYEQETYKEELVKKYGDKLIVDCIKGNFCYSYSYRLK